jgi:mevalonate kinase
VHDRPAVAVATSLRTTAYLEQLHDPEIILSFPDLHPEAFTVPFLALHACSSLAVSSPAPCPPEFTQLLQSVFARHATEHQAASAPFAAAAVPALFLLLSLAAAPDSSAPGLRLRVSSDLPVGAGLGSSAAFSVSVAAAALQLSAMVAAASGSPSPSVRIERALVNDWALQARPITESMFCCCISAV